MKIICVQGLGFVGSAMAVAIASSQKFSKVIGVEVNNKNGRDKVSKLNQGIFPFNTSDQLLLKKTKTVVKENKLMTTTDDESYKLADVVLMCVPFNISSLDKNAKPIWEDIVSASEVLARKIKSNCLVILQSTVLPGTLRRVIHPIFKKIFKGRGFKENPQLAYSYERVMPGKNYLKSITHNFRCYAGLCKKSERKCKTFFSKFINTKKFSITKLETTESTEIAKIMENSYRAVNIAFIEEWAEYSESIGVNLFEIIKAIGLRETHKNIAKPGFGVGGYCLTKDPLFAGIAARHIQNTRKLKFPFSELAIKTNQFMPKRCLYKLEGYLKSLKNKKILIAGVSYKGDVGDDRFSPTIDFYNLALKKGAKIFLSDPLLTKSELIKRKIETNINNFNFEKLDVIVLAVKHEAYLNKKIFNLILSIRRKIIIFDACNLLSDNQIKILKLKHEKLYIVGRGEI